MAQAVAMLSGGLDSAVATALYREEAANSIATALFFDYGQRACKRELEAATALCANWGVPLRTIDLPWLAELAELSGSALVPGANPLPVGTCEQPGSIESARAVWVPARNAVFVSVAAAFAETLAADDVIAGFNREEAQTFADNSADFVAAGTAFLASGTKSGVRVMSPTLDLDKVEIVAEAKRLGFVKDDFWSCYEGGEEPCGRCESCLRSCWDR